ncbi:gafA [Scenedesmus sp. PABB004]|nr:gafA [Scenedesmus sp. PABB004]
MPELTHAPLPLGADAAAKAAHYAEVCDDIRATLAGEPNFVAAMATVASVLHHAFDCFSWTGFYVAEPGGADELVVGPYQGSLGCLRIPFARGVCGAAARTRATQVVPDVAAFPGHIACASSTRSELVVPLLCPASGRVLAVLDVDSDAPAAFDAVDAQALEGLAAWLASKYGEQQPGARGDGGAG